MKKEVLKLLFAESLFHQYQLANALKRHPLIQAREKPVSLIVLMLNKFCIPEGNVFVVCVGICFTGSVNLSARKYFMFGVCVA